MTEPVAQSTVLVDNDRVRVTEWRFTPGTATGHHRHDLDYVVVPTTAGTLLVRSDAGESANDLTLGAPYFREAGAEHNVVNNGSEEIAFIEIELK